MLFRLCAAGRYASFESTPLLFLRYSAAIPLVFWLYYFVPHFRVCPRTLFPLLMMMMNCTF